MQRLAIFYTPHPDSEMALSASVWLGRDVYGKKSSEPVAIDGLSALRRLQLVSTPAHYGFHATIKAPFQLLEQKSVQSLKQRLLQFAGGWQSLELPPLEVSFMHDFFCLRPAVPCLPLTNLAAEAIHFFPLFCDGCTSLLLSYFRHFFSLSLMLLLFILTSLKEIRIILV
jgi:hypothetical protein